MFCHAATIFELIHWSRVSLCPTSQCSQDPKRARSSRKSGLAEVAELSNGHISRTEKINELNRYVNEPPLVYVDRSD